MEELQDAIEDAQYVSAISSVDAGPRPVLPWDIPDEAELTKWKDGLLLSHAKEKNAPTPFSFEWTLAHAIGFFLFSAYLKESVGDYIGINFMEEVVRWKQSKGRIRAEKTAFIVTNYLAPVAESVKSGGDLSLAVAGAVAHDAVASPLPIHVEKYGYQEVTGPMNKIHPFVGPPKTEIMEYSLAREPTPFLPDMQELHARNSGPIRSCIDVGGEILESILLKVEKLRKLPGFGSLSTDPNKVTSSQNATQEGGMQQLSEKMRSRTMSIMSSQLPENLFEDAELLVSENIREKYWAGFLSSEYHKKVLNFLWFQDRTVVEEDFFIMRVLGRGGFGLVTACKKGTSGKLYAMKVMNKKRIKLKKAEKLTLNEQNCLADVNSPFVVNLKYSFQSKTDVFLILDLMTGGDLAFHLSQKGFFPKEECRYYSARILLGLQALHDRGYVYRDLKPENCLLGDDGRVKLTDLGLAIKVTSDLHGAAGTRGYWAPEMLDRDENGKRKNYGRMVDWFSFGCCLAEFISGTSPFRSQEALDFGFEKGHTTKEKAIDCATIEMHPVFDGDKFNEDAADICRRLLDKDDVTRLGINGCNDIRSHPYFGKLNWDDIISDRMRPPFIPLVDVNAASQSEIGTFLEDKTFQDTFLTEKDELMYDNWNFTNPKAFAEEVIEFLIYERTTGKPLLPIVHKSSCCCTIV